MSSRFFLAVALSVASLGVAACLAGRGLPWPTNEMVRLSVPDLDLDGQPETLSVTTEGGNWLVWLDGTHVPHHHPMMTVPGQGKLTSATSPMGWHLVDADGATQIDVRTYEPGNGLARQVGVFAQGEGRRYIWVDRGFLKCESRAIIPGFSLGTVILGDDARALEAFAEPAGDGLLTLPGAADATFRYEAGEDGRVSKLVSESTYFATAAGVGIGIAGARMESAYEGSRAGADWVSPRYGLIGTIGADGKVSALAISKPWTTQGSMPSKPGAGAQPRQQTPAAAPAAGDAAEDGAGG